ncbi:MAG TPA: GNAT family N-acetyltransferase [Streptosporangiaceae bacterium]|jgi:diamine N-acetyltransferase
MPSGPRLEQVTLENVRAACQIRLEPEQEHLVAPVAYSLADAYAAGDIAWPRLVYDGERLVGFVMVAFDPGNPLSLYHCYLWRLNISAGGQGRGYGRFAVSAVAEEAVRRGQHRMTVSYHPGDGGPEGFYARLGFRPTGEHIQDEVVAERMLTPASAT